jgi:hypothetical protein
VNGTGSLNGCEVRDDASDREDEAQARSLTAWYEE